MSQPEAKRQKTDDAYSLIYWPGLPGRAEFIRLLFEETQTPSTDHSKEAPGDAVGKVTALTDAEYKGDDTNPAIFAVPALKHRDLLINQLPNILQYIAPKLDLAPEPTDPGFYHLNEIVLTLLDGFSNEVHETHHPIATSQVYEDQKPEAKKRAKAYTDERLPGFLSYTQRVLDGKSSGDGPWLYGGKLTYADIVLFQCIDGTQFAFPKAMAKAKESGKYDGVFKLYDEIKERPNIKEYLGSDRRCQYGNGIWRQYPELEE
ncbi:hypothetical protein Golomagni_06664 [Golovinomyces magnicellulatus]|nr:hypothetical protein Golomagni_06664 [Golovinomyces magnicellulatus]